jgi:DNA-directed RNA polymerase specialized sigma24 family protein
MSMHPEVLRTLVAHHRQFLAFLVPRVGSQEAAEEVLQAAFVKGVEKGEGLRLPFERRPLPSPLL